MEIIPGLLPEYILLGSILVIFLMLSMGKKNLSSFVYAIITIVGELLAGLSCILLYERNTEKFLNGYLQTDSSFLLIRVFIFLVSAILVLYIQLGKEIKESQKSEIFFLIAWVSLLDSVLLLSRNLLLSYLCIAAVIIISVFLTIIPEQSRKVIRIAFKGWEQSLVCLLLGFISLFILSLVGGEFTMDGIRSVVTQSENNHFYLILLVFLFLPYWKVSGIFPFNFSAVQQARNSTWGLQAVQTILVQGIGVVFFSKVLVTLYSSLDLQGFFKIPVWFETISIVGIFFSAVTALILLDIKSFISQLAFLQWSVYLLTVSASNSSALAASLFRFLSSGISLLLAFIILGAFFEGKKQYSWVDLYGFGKKHLFEGVMLCVGFISMLGFPPFFGFLSEKFFYQTNFVNSGVDIQLVLILVAGIQAVIAGKTISYIFFRYESNHSNSIPILESTSVRIIILFLVSILLSAGLFGETLWNTLLEKTNSFIIL